MGHLPLPSSLPCACWAEVSIAADTGSGLWSIASMLVSTTVPAKPAPAQGQGCWHLPGSRLQLCCWGFPISSHVWVKSYFGFYLPLSSSTLTLGPRHKSLLLARKSSESQARCSFQNATRITRNPTLILICGNWTLQVSSTLSSCGLSLSQEALSLRYIDTQEAYATIIHAFPDWDLNPNGQWGVRASLSSDPRYEVMNNWTN